MTKKPSKKATRKVIGTPVVPPAPPTVFHIPEDVVELFHEAVGYEILRDRYIARPFGFSKAAKASKMAQVVSNKFWNSVYRLYPALRGQTLTFDKTANAVRLHG